MNLTEEQQNLLETHQKTKDNLSVVARAGCAKSTMIGLMAEQDSGAVLALAFNRAIKEELAHRMPDAEVKTLNAIGHKAFAQFLGKYNKPDSRKVWRLVNEADPDNKGVIAQAVAYSKSLGYAPHANAKGLLGEAELRAALPMELDDGEFSCVTRIAAKSFSLMLDGDIDFDDQVLAATTLPCSFDRYDTIYVDEAQDLSPLNHAMIKKIARSRARVVQVGDPAQAIYGFRGASMLSMEQMKETFSMGELRLTTSFRCPERIVSHVAENTIVSDMTAWEGNTTVGAISSGEIDLGVLRDNPSYAILCRRNAPLVKLSMELFSQGINAEYVGHDVVRKMILTIKGLGSARTPQRKAIAAVTRWETEQKKRWRNISIIEDQADCMRIILGMAPTLGDALRELRKLEKAKGRVKLMTVHKAKGLEFKNVTILEPELLNGTTEQEPNIKYVALTRTLDRLIYVDV